MIIFIYSFYHGVLKERSPVGINLIYNRKKYIIKIILPGLFQFPIINIRQIIVREFDLLPRNANIALDLWLEGVTVPFIARYRSLESKLSCIKQYDYVFGSEEFSTRNLPGIDIPFRQYDPRYPPNWIVVRAGQNPNFKDEAYDCSEIAEDLLQAAKGKGRIIEITPVKGKTLKVLEKSGIFGDYDYHQVYTDGRYVYDPRLNPNPVPKGDWEKLMRGTNPSANFRYLR